MEVYVLFRSSLKTGKIDTTITAISPALLKIWALNNTCKGKFTTILNRTTGVIEAAFEGKTNDFPNNVTREYATCEDIGISLEDLQQIKDERFDTV